MRRPMRETFSGQMQFDYFPVSIDQLKANVDYRDLEAGSFEIGDIRITAQYLNHTSVTLGYRLEADGVVVVYDKNDSVGLTHWRGTVGNEMQNVAPSPPVSYTSVPPNASMIDRLIDNPIPMPSRLVVLK